MSNKEKLQQNLKIHIIRDVKILAYALPTSSLLTTVQGFDLSVTCGNNNNEIGELYINDKSCKIVQRYLEFDGGVAYGIDCLLTDPNLGSRCDTFLSHDILPAQEGQKLHVAAVGHVMRDILVQDCVPVTVASMGLHVSFVCPEDMAQIADMQCQSVHPAVPLMLCARPKTSANVNYIILGMESLAQKGYKGDGHICTAVNPCTDGLNGGCHEHAICTKTGPGKRKCECKDNYIGDGIDCEVKQQRGNRCLQDHGQCHADADCVDLHFEDARVGVFHIRSPLGQYKLTYDEANKTCADEGATLATYTQLLYAQKAKYHLCAAGWLQNRRVGYPTAFSAPNCGGGLVGIVDYGIKVNQSERWDAFCYRVKDVNCTCKIGYVGDGFTCTGNLLQVLVSIPTFANFASKVHTYSNTSRKGQEFLKYLTNLSIKATLFVPDNDGLKKNETLSGRDIEYHLSNVSMLFYEDLTNGTTLQTRIGKKLLIIHGENQENQASVAKKRAMKYVDGRAILGWDIVASNGIIHVIAAPLKAPPLPPAFLHLGTGIFFVVLLLIGIIGLIGYAYFRFKRGDIHFQRFKDSDVQELVTDDPPAKL
uniref:Uncharacterized protein n=1 Tax=Sphaerodactylus townsendi TaxID=933632 RepID=A0ACB8FP10_9SAUR